MSFLLFTRPHTTARARVPQYHSPVFEVECFLLDGEDLARPTREALISLRAPHSEVGRHGRVQPFASRSLGKRGPYRIAMMESDKCQPCHSVNDCMDVVAMMAMRALALVGGCAVLTGASKAADPCQPHGETNVLTGECWGAGGSPGCFSCFYGDHCDQ